MNKIEKDIVIYKENIEQDKLKEIEILYINKLN